MNRSSATLGVHVNAHLGSREQDTISKTPLEEFAAELRDVLESQGVSRNRLAKQTGLSPSAISNYTIGRDTPPPSAVFAIEEALGLAGGHLSAILGFKPAGDLRPPGFVEALMADPKLKPEHKKSLLGIYRGLIATLEG